jgi:hypothetical protein
MNTFIAAFIFFFVLAMVFRWVWNFFLRDFCMILLPPIDHPNAEEMEGLFDAYDKAYTDKKRGKKK